ncbi:MAG: hypothetical protein GY841_03430 [FCB group bacterium]|nr:hypothetical protein [FCB group bacterium]
MIPSLKLPYILLLFIGLIVWIGCGDDDDNIVDPNNQAPIIESLTAEPDTFVADYSSLITVTASDPDGDNLQYNWVTDSSGFAGTPSGNTLTLTNCCIVHIPKSTWVHAIVSDNRGGEARDSIKVWVTP